MVPQVKNRPAPKRAMAGVIAIVMAILLLPFAAASPARADTVSVRQAVVHLKQTWTAHVYVPLATPLSGKLTAVTSCSAAFISAQADILTAGHCVDPQQGFRQLQARCNVEFPDVPGCRVHRGGRGHGARHVGRPGTQCQ